MVEVLQRRRLTPILKSWPSPQNGKRKRLRHLCLQPSFSWSPLLQQRPRSLLHCPFPKACDRTLEPLSGRRTSLSQPLLRHYIVVQTRLYPSRLFCRQQRRWALLSVIMSGVVATPTKQVAQPLSLVARPSSPPKNPKPSSSKSKNKGKVVAFPPMYSPENTNSNYLFEFENEYLFKKYIT